MIYSRESHYLFLEEELRAQTDEFKRKLETNARYLLEEREEVFVCQFIKFEDGEMILKFSTNRGLPRKGDYLYCFTVPTHLRNYREWGDATYGELIKNKGYASEVVCIWQSALPDTSDFCIAGFRGVDMEFAEHIQGKTGALLVLGPNVPPYEYIHNLQKIVKREGHSGVSDILDRDYKVAEWEPIPLDNRDIATLIVNQLEFSDSVILQGPPGTGKTHQIANICEKLSAEGKTILVTALTNRALVEVAKKEALNQVRSNSQIFKTKLSVDESKELNSVLPAKELLPMPGCIMLSTFYIASGEASSIFSDPPFDVVIMDEASQALLAMFAAVKLLGKKQIYVGDVNQLPPVIAVNSDRVAKRNYTAFVDGMKTLSDAQVAPTYSLIETRRLSQRGTQYTGLFYNNLLICKSQPTRLRFPELGNIDSTLLHSEGGPALMTTDLPVGDKRPIGAIQLATAVVGSFLTANEKLNIAVLSFYVETTKALQKGIYQKLGTHNQLLIETVSRIQGLTTDVVIYVVPNTGYNRSLERRLFNVATSRATRHTIIIADKNILELPSYLDHNVRDFVGKLAKENWIHFPIVEPSGKLVENVPKQQHSYELEASGVQCKELPTQQAADENIEIIETKDVKIKIVGKIDLSKFEKPKKEIKKGLENLYVIDTNIFVQCPDIISKLDKKYPILLSAKVIDELDKLKIVLSGEDRKKVGLALYNINKAMEVRDVRLELSDLDLLPGDFSRKSPDNNILTVALKYKNQNPILLTSDNGLQIKAKGLNITTISLKDYLRQLKF